MEKEINNILDISSMFTRYLWGEERFDYKNVVLMIMDGMGCGVLERHLSADSFLRRHMVKEIATVFPSTTTAATTTLKTGLPPAEHGWFGWDMYFAEDNKIVTLYMNTDYSFKRLPFRAFYDRESDIDIYTCFPGYVKYGCADKNFYHKTTEQFFANIDRVCKVDGKKFVYSYCGEPDRFMHDNGVGSAKDLVKQINDDIEKLVTQNPDTLFVITADHGHIDVTEHIEIYKDADIMECLNHYPTLEPRATAYHVKAGMHESFRKAFKKYEQDFDLFATGELIDRGVFGEFKGEENKRFLGDYISIGKESNKAFLLNPDQPKLKGSHTGMTRDEMIVPLVIIRNK